MRVVFISRGWWPNVRGGSERFVYRVATELFRRGYEVVGIYYRFPSSDEAEAPFKLIVSGSGSYNYLKALIFSHNAARKASELNPDVVIVNGYWSESSPIFIRGKLRVIYLVHDLGFLSEGGAMSFIKKLIVKYSIKYSDVVIVPTKVVMEELVRELGIDGDKVRVLGFEGVDAPFKYVHVSNEYFDIVHVGRFSPNKGHLILLKAFREVVKEVSNARLWLVGGSDPKGSEYLSRVKEVASRINEELGREVVKVVINAPDITKYYELADLCVAPSLSAEGFGLSVAECMGYGKPVIVSELFRETGVVSEDSAIIVPKGDAESLAKAIKEVARDRDLARRLGMSGLRRSREFRWGRVADFVEGVINELISK